MQPTELPYGIERDEPKPDWHFHGNCADLTLEESDRHFFPRNGGVKNATREMCETCPVRADCIVAGLQEPDAYSRESSHSTRGIWGGLQPRDLEDVRTQLAEGGINIPHTIYDRYTTAGRAGYGDKDEDNPKPLTEALDAVAGDQEAVIETVRQLREGMFDAITTG